MIDDVWEKKLPILDFCFFVVVIFPTPGCLADGNASRQMCCLLEKRIDLQLV